MLGIWKIIYRNITYQKLRTALTLLGIVIGIAAITSMVTLGDALENSINEQFEQMGTDKIIITPGSPNSIGFSGAALSTDSLDESDVKVVERIKNVETAFGTVSKTAELTMGKKTTYGVVYAWDISKAGDLYSEMQGYEIEYGRDLRVNDKYSMVIGNMAKTELFDKEIKIRDRIGINGKNFRVVGILKKIGNPIDDMAMMIPISGANEAFNQSTQYSMIFVDTRDDIDIEKVSDEIKKELKDHRNAENFKVQTFGDLMDMANTILNLLETVFIGIAAISLLVGGIGIMNIMLMTVMERTKEIGIMKATGATNMTVLLLFLGEAAMVGLIGGLIGFGIGYIGSFIVGGYAGTMVSIPITIPFSMDLFIGSIIFSMVVGMLSGAYPARKASLMDPVDALRYE